VPPFFPGSLLISISVTRASPVSAVLQTLCLFFFWNTLAHKFQFQGLRRRPGCSFSPLALRSKKRPPTSFSLAPGLQLPSPPRSSKASLTPLSASPAPARLTRAAFFSSRFHFYPLKGSRFLFLLFPSTVRFPDQAMLLRSGSLAP